MCPALEREFLKIGFKPELVVHRDEGGGQTGEGLLHARGHLAKSDKCQSHLFYIYAKYLLISVGGCPAVYKLKEMGESESGKLEQTCKVTN